MCVSRRPAGQQVSNGLALLRARSRALGKALFFNFAITLPRAKVGSRQNKIFAESQVQGLSANLFFLFFSH